MPSIRASEQDSEVRAHLQVRQCPTGTCVGEGCDAGIADLVAGETEPLALRLCPTGTRRGECSEAGVADLVGA